MQEFKMSLTELKEKFTKSEMAIMSYSSIEQMDNLEKSSNIKTRNRLTEVNEEQSETPERFYNEEGEIDLRKVTGKEAWNYLKSQGLTFLPIHRNKG